MAIVVILAGSWLGYRQLANSGCTGSIKLNVAAAPEIAPAIERTAAKWTEGGAQVNGTCVAVTVNAINPAQMAAAIAREHQVTLVGLGTAPQSVVTPDVWLPDSSTWLLRLKSEASGFVPTDGKSVAQSPIVVAMPVPVAQQAVGWPDKKLGWKDLLGKMVTSNTLRTGIVDPTRDAAGLAGLLALGQSAGAGPNAQAAKVGALRALAAGSSAVREDLLQKFPHSEEANDIASSLSAAPLSEEDVVSFNAEGPPIKLAALYLDPMPPPLDYPFAVMPEVDLTKAAAANGLRQELQKPEFKNALASVGLRGPDGTKGAGFATPVGAPEATPPASASGDSQGGAAASGLDASVLSQALGSWAAITLPGRALAVFDVSGSMLKPVPTANNLTRAQVTQRAASQGLSLFDDRWAVGVWVFSTELQGKQPWREIVPISPLTSARGQIQESIQKLTPKPNGATGLYDTALAAYKTVEDSWQPGRVNSVLLFTDGKNENKDGISRDQLISELKKLNNPKRPVRMVIIGIGDEVDRNELQAITDATSSGGVFIAPDPAKISDIFLEAISSRTGANR
ncbi:substrate-binding domain-containing protein [Krasilnikovia sp. MM14-A1259]|uniref:substrate-binding domain-containing protein n=1 Tax=Krasilnikovia sp. MM14-A1259 TaxID=3373539 RepID=UPI00382871C4